MSVSASPPMERLLGLISSARPQGRGWVARCPAHHDRDPSLALAEGDDGRVLLHCFAGCSTKEIVSALRLAVSDLFDGPHTTTSSGDNRRGIPVQAQLAYWRAALGVLDREATIVLLAAEQLSTGENLNDVDATRLNVATARIADARQVLRVH